MEKEWKVKVQADTVRWPKEYITRRASVSSFGYGGTNGHVIVESIDSLYPWYQHAKPKKEAQYNRSSDKPFLLCFSAHDEPTLTRNVAAIAAVAPEFYLTDLSHTLNLHRTKFSHRAFTIAREGREFKAFTSATLQSGAVSKTKVGVGFLFTGQGVSAEPLREAEFLANKLNSGTMGGYGQNCSSSVPDNTANYPKARPDT